MSCLYYREMLSSAIDRLGGYQADLWSVHSLAERLNTIQAKVPREEFQLETAQSRLQCLKINKIQDVVVSEKTNMRDLNIAVLMTDWDYIAPVYFHRWRHGAVLAGRFIYYNSLISGETL